MNLFLQAALKVQPNDTVSCYDIFKDFIFPSGIMIITIVASILLAKEEFKRVNKHEEDKQKEENRILKEMIFRNLRIISTRSKQDVSNFRKMLKAAYDLKKPLFPSDILLNYPELNSLLAVDSMRMQKILTINHSEESLNNIYQVMGALNLLNESYLKISDEFIKTNTSIKNYQIDLLRASVEFENVIEDAMRKEPSVELNLLGSKPINTRERLIISNLIQKYKLGFKTTYNFIEVIDELEEIDSFKYLLQNNFYSISLPKNNIVNNYTQLDREIQNFHSSIGFLCNRMNTSILILENFTNSSLNS